MVVDGPLIGSEAAGKSVPEKVTLLLCDKKKVEIDIKYLAVEMREAARSKAFTYILEQVRKTGSSASIDVENVEELVGDSLCKLLEIQLQRILFESIAEITQRNYQYHKKNLEGLAKELGIEVGNVKSGRQPPKRPENIVAPRG
ncbi:hypothetical protein A3G55_03985 [Candidatus Giovannonibacteria bacterium RIFCSPLOWO2_12_FULL_44_25]|uniref:Uncharacterized protein n=4 Tax=Candidatus Giovannoniibacteriota TaxID=1752738 RepID=A0A0G1KL32_9BACT|nr:MAG: hypothetical protein UW15_C0005G0032 [Parcubacteria group bacterium GW2011_GWC1_44_10]KKT57012.1 MAG: hypothetical protein UW49_C0009G0033 [Candidatus Giovannonibacteria bacterium GW2011_GWB1_44_23]KKT59622.1 MAG: hypothetical protein UW53_C0010G0032 [Candidatus Giovannonibacteria bacterium GW2011_GWA1_44_25]KKT82820.1 MAG: hypothetical protein UW81_C0035G0007 [Candidatus Giovannonibacteria bacterium GW2011_GWC2_44_9]OGF49832.1 MAG: hypothetical protein A2120_01270 [Candidatus Giovannon